MTRHAGPSCAEDREPASARDTTRRPLTGRRDPDANAWAARSDLTPCRKPLAFVGAVLDELPPAERAARLGFLEDLAHDLAWLSGDAEIDRLLADIRHRLAVLALGGGA